jgi:beta-galactosidase
MRRSPPGPGPATNNPVSPPIMKNLVLPSIFALAAIGATAAAAELPAPISLDGEWRFHLAPGAEAAEAFTKFHDEKFDAAAFVPIAVPSNWNMLGFEDPYYVNGTESEGFYLRTFEVPKAAEGRRALLHFDGVWQSAEVWLNGQRLGRHDSGFTAFAFDATAALKPGAVNRIAVRVRQRTQTFKFDANDDWALAGIYRGVRLSFTPKEWWIENVEAVTDFDALFRDADLRLRVHVMRNERADYYVPSPPVVVRATVSTREGVVVARDNISATVTNGHNGRDVAMTVRVVQPAPWTAETPNLYDLKIELVRDETVLHSWSDRIGFREVSTAGGVLRVNGQTVRLRGVARHDQHPDVGRATRPEHWLEDIKLMKAANINAVRTAHYPPAEGFIRLCDEMGLYVVDEIPFGFGGDRMNDPALAEGAFLRVYETVARDRNRPSVIVWSLGNEDPFTALHLAALRALKGLDSTRPVLAPFHAEDELPPEIDILAPHYWKAAEFDRGVARATRPLMPTEYTHALGPDDFGGLQDRWDAITRHPSGAGGFIWVWADQGLRRSTKGREVVGPLDKAKYTREGNELVRLKDAGPDAIYDAHGNFGTDGIVDPDRAPQVDYWETKAVYAPVRLLVDRVAFERGQPSVALPVRNDYDFTDLASLRVTWKVLRDGAELAAGDTRVTAAPHTLAALTIPTTSIAADARAGAYYVHVGFLDAQGTEITRRSVILGDLPDPQKTEAAAKSAVAVKAQGDSVVITAGTARYEFDARAGVLVSAELAGNKVVQGSDLVVWRTATLCEHNVLDRKPVQRDWDSFLQGMKPSARSWNVAGTPQYARVTTTVEYRQDEKNSVEVDYVYLVQANGALRVDYTVKPHVDVESLTEIGVELQTGSALRDVTWLGLGTRESLPNRMSAALFGQWSTPVDGVDARGTKSGVEWLRCGLGGGAELKVTGVTAFRLGQDATGAQRLRLLSEVAGAWVKGGPPERAEWRLDLAEGRTFHGSLELQPVLPPAPVAPKR